MKSNKKITAKTVSLTLCAAMACSCIGMLAYAAGEKSGESQLTAAVTQTVDTQKTSDTSKTASKDETVYVIAGADGSAKKIIVSDWIKNTAGSSSLDDSTELKDVTNVKGEQGYTMNGDNARIWDAAGGDIYYQGSIEKDLPVSLKVSYQLDGNPISAEDLAGKSGKVTIRFDYKNNQYETVKINGKDEKIYVPFVMLTGMIVDNDNFRNVEVSNGKLINDGDHTVIAGIALPGMQDSLQLDKDTLTIPDYVEITADVTDFSLATTMTVASNEVFNNIDTSGLDQYDDLTDAMDDLTSAMKQLLDGSSQLYDGLSTLLSKSDTLITGIDRLATGAKELASGASQLESGAKDLNSGASQLADGLDTLSGNSATLNGGAKQVFDTLLSTADTQIAAAGLQADKLTVSNYQTVLNKVIASLDSDAVQKLAYNTALKQVTAAVNAKEPEIRTGVTAAVQSKVLEGVLAAAGQSMTAEQYQQAVEAGVVPEAMQQQVAAAVNAQMQTEAVQSQINQNVEAQKQKLIDQNMKSDEVTGKIQQAVASAKQGKAQLQNLLEQLNSYNTFYQGVLQYTGGVDTAAQGAAELESGSSKLSAGATTLSKGADALKSGIGELQTGADALVDGVSQLKDGSMQLSDGLKEFDESGVQKLVDAVDGDLNGIITRFKAMLDVSTDYRSFGGISEDMDGSVKFIYKTDEISKD